jgi:hypothetical protein
MEFKYSPFLPLKARGEIKKIVEKVLDARNSNLKNASKEVSRWVHTAAQLLEYVELGD